MRTKIAETRPPPRDGNFRGARSCALCVLCGYTGFGCNPAQAESGNQELRPPSSRCPPCLRGSPALAPGATVQAGIHHRGTKTRRRGEIRPLRVHQELSRRVSSFPRFLFLRLPLFLSPRVFHVFLSSSRSIGPQSVGGCRRAAPPLVGKVLELVGNRVAVRAAAGLCWAEGAGRADATKLRPLLP
jgi:hypothetical protein